MIAFLTANLTDKNEVEFGSSLSVTCKLEGGRTPFYLALTREHYDQNETIVHYNSTVNTTSAEVVVGSNTLTYVHSMNSVSYSGGGTYNCEGKNKALENKEKSSSSQLEVFVGKLQPPLLKKLCHTRASVIDVSSNQ